MRALTLVSALLGFLLVAVAAVGAHLVLAPIRAADALSPLLHQWDQAITLGLLHVLAALACVALPAARFRTSSGRLFVAGVVLFSLVQLARIAGAPLPAFLVPIGGLSMMAGWVALAASAALAKRD